MLIIDTREPLNVRVDVASAVQPQHVRELALLFGDFRIEDKCDPPCSYGLERKTWGDFLGSMSDGRAERQIPGLLAHYTVPILVIQGHYRVNDEGYVRYEKYLTKWHHNRMQAHLLDIQAQGVKIVHINGPRELTMLIGMLHRRALKGCIAGRKNEEEIAA